MVNLRAGLESYLPVWVSVARYGQWANPGQTQRAFLGHKGRVRCPTKGQLAGHLPVVNRKTHSSLRWRVCDAVSQLANGGSSRMTSSCEFSLWSRVCDAVSQLADGGSSRMTSSCESLKIFANGGSSRTPSSCETLPLLASLWCCEWFRRWREFANDLFLRKFEEIRQQREIANSLFLRKFPFVGEFVMLWVNSPMEGVRELPLIAKVWRNSPTEGDRELPPLAKVSLCWRVCDPVNNFADGGSWRTPFDREWPLDRSLDWRQPVSAQKLRLTLEYMTKD